MKSVIDTYLLCKESEGRAKSTLYEYRLYLTQFDTYCHKPLDQITNSDIAGWIVQERQKHYADATILARHRALRIFFNWCVEYELLIKSPIRMKNPKVPKQIPRIASLASVQKLLSVPADTWLDLRNIALVALLLDTGMRIGEALSLQVAHIQLEQRIALIPPGKDKEGRIVPFTADCRSAIIAYLRDRPVSPFRWLFVGSYNAGHGNPIVSGRFTPVGARLMLQGFCKRAGVAYINPRSIRHLFATKALNDGIRAEVVSKILGHSSVDLTLRIYAKLLTDTIRKEYDALWKICTIS